MANDTVSFRDALVWLNMHLELLARNQLALAWMRKLAFLDSDGVDSDPDFQLLSSEAERLLNQIVYWEAVVDRLGLGARIRPNVANEDRKD